MNNKKQYSSMKDMKDELESMIKRMRKVSVERQSRALTRGDESDPQTNNNISKITNAKDDPFLNP